MDCEWLSSSWVVASTTIRSTEWCPLPYFDRLLYCPQIDRWKRWIPLFYTINRHKLHYIGSRIKDHRCFWARENKLLTESLLGGNPSVSCADRNVWNSERQCQQYISASADRNADKSPSDAIHSFSAASFPRLAIESTANIPRPNESKKQQKLWISAWNGDSDEITSKPSWYLCLSTKSWLCLTRRSSIFSSFLNVQ